MLGDQADDDGENLEDMEIIDDVSIHDEID
jgi:hypothetical protein